MLLIPLSDENPLRFVRYQWVTIGIIAINVVVYLLQFSGLLLAAGSSLSGCTSRADEQGHHLRVLSRAL